MHRPRDKFRHGFLVATCFVGVAWGAPTAPAKITAEDLLVVDCLLPGQVRQLGRRTTYVSPRRPVKTTALDCRVRHGEYVVSDRADLRTALNVWLEQAKAGDPEAQTTVGEIFERGMGVGADHTAAAAWYRRAAEAGHTRAQVNLGHLYEKGLGVPQDPRAALAWYRRAAGLEAAVALEPTAEAAPVQTARQQELQQLRARARSLEAQLHALTSELQAARQMLERPSAPEANPEAEPEARPKPPAEPDLQPGPRSEPEPASEERVDLENLRASFGAQLERLNVTVAVREQEANTLRQELQRLRDELVLATERALDAQQQLAAQSEALGDVEVERRQAHAAAQEYRVQLARAVEALDTQTVRFEERSAELVRLRDELEAFKRASADAAAQGPVAAAVDVAGPSITIIDPSLPRARGLVKVSLPAAASVDRLVGRVVAPAGLLTLSVNGASVTPNRAGVFVAELVRRGGPMDVAVVAVDQQGKRADVQFTVAPADAVADERVAADPVSRVDLGSYHALLIGNNNYRHLPRLSTAINDVRRTASVLERRYGFQTTVLEDATRYQILTALNDLRGRLTSKDNLLIYYAGHGELDDVNLRGHWLPVDAELDNTSNWLSNVAITDILNIIQAKHVLLIADSCYSGTLTRSSIARQQVALTDAERVTWLELMSKKRARVVLTSGGLAPVLDAGGGAHSVFAKALIEVLESNGELIEGRSLYQAVAARVAHAAASLRFEQTPQYAPIASAGHESGDFFLRPARL